MPTHFCYTSWIQCYALCPYLTQKTLRIFIPDVSSDMIDWLPLLQQTIIRFDCFHQKWLNDFRNHITFSHIKDSLIITDNNTKHTKRRGYWNSITPIGSWAKLTQWVCIYTHACVMYLGLYRSICVCLNIVSPTVLVCFRHSPAFCILVKGCNKTARRSPFIAFQWEEMDVRKLKTFMFVKQ